MCRSCPHEGGPPKCRPCATQGEPSHNFHLECRLFGTEGSLAFDIERERLEARPQHPPCQPPHPCPGPGRATHYRASRWGPAGSGRGLTSRAQVRRHDRADLDVPIERGSGAYSCEEPVRRFVEICRGAPEATGWRAQVGVPPPEGWVPVRCAVWSKLPFSGTTSMAASSIGWCINFVALALGRRTTAATARSDERWWRLWAPCTSPPAAAHWSLCEFLSAARRPSTLAPTRA
jgi:hypothetical protein